MKNKHLKVYSLKEHGMAIRLAGEIGTNAAAKRLGVIVDTVHSMSQIRKCITASLKKRTTMCSELKCGFSKNCKELCLEPLLNHLAIGDITNPEHSLLCSTVLGEYL